MLKFLAILATLFFIVTTDTPRKNYLWLEKYDAANTIEKRIQTPTGFTRVPTAEKTFAHWLRNLPVKPANTPVKLWNGEIKYSQAYHCAVVDLDFIGGNLQQCIDVIIRLRAEYLLSAERDNEIKFSYSCCSEKIAWQKWKQGWRTKIVKTKNGSAFEWIKTQKPDSSTKTFRAYLQNVMNYAGTLSLARDMKKIDYAQMTIGDAFVQGAQPGAGHGVIILDAATNKDGKKIFLLGQSYNPAENFNVIKSGGKYSPWFEADFETELQLPQWTFLKEHARRFE